MTDILIEIKINELYKQFHCMTRCSQSVVDRLDSWAKHVKGSLENCIDLMGAKAIYHKSCHARFCSSKDLTSPSEKRKSLGRTQKHSMLSAFNNLCDWLTDEEELYTLGELHE